MQPNLNWEIDPVDSISIETLESSQDKGLRR